MMTTDGSKSLTVDDPLQCSVAAAAAAAHEACLQLAHLASTVCEFGPLAFKFALLCAKLALTIAHVAIRCSACC